jgi:3-oxoacyl-[acyl-carrier protein] reductase
MHLADKNVLVTGGAKGIGRAVVAGLLQEGARVAVFDVDVAGLATLQQDCAAVRCIPCDVTDARAVGLAVERLYEDLGEIHALVNNAGILFSKPLVSLTPQGLVVHEVDLWDRVIATDLSSVFYVTRSVVEKMVKRRTRGAIVNISSVSAAGNAGQSAYSAAKAAVNALTATWAKELGLLGIRVVGVAPGFTDTESTQAAVSSEVLRNTIQRVPLRRLGKPQEIAQGVLSVLQNEFITGTTIEIDGGLKL